MFRVVFLLLAAGSPWQFVDASVHSGTSIQQLAGIRRNLQEMNILEVCDQFTPGDDDLIHDSSCICEFIDGNLKAICSNDYSCVAPVDVNEEDWFTGDLSVSVVIPKDISLSTAETLEKLDDGEYTWCFEYDVLYDGSTVCVSDFDFTGRADPLCIINIDGAQCNSCRICAEEAIPSKESTVLLVSYDCSNIIDGETLDECADANGGHLNESVLRFLDVGAKLCATDGPDKLSTGAIFGVVAFVGVVFVGAFFGFRKWKKRKLEITKTIETAEEPVEYPVDEYPVEYPVEYQD
jgi:hypothetical protein